MFYSDSEDDSYPPICSTCERVRKRKPFPNVGQIEHCSLCDRFYCEAHKSNEQGVCEVNHVTYYKKHHGNIFPSSKARDDAGYSSTWVSKSGRLLRYDEIAKASSVSPAQNQTGSLKNEDETKASAEPAAEKQTVSLKQDSEATAPADSMAPIPGMSTNPSTITR